MRPPGIITAKMSFESTRAESSGSFHCVLVAWDPCQGRYQPEMDVVSLAQQQQEQPVDGRQPLPDPHRHVILGPRLVEPVSTSSGVRAMKIDHPARFALTTHWQLINQVKKSVGEILPDHSNLRRLINLTRAATLVRALALGDLTARRPRLLLLLEKLRMRARSYKDDGATFQPVDQQEVAADVAFAVVHPAAFERVIQPFRAQRRIVANEQQHRFL